MTLVVQKDVDWAILTQTFVRSIRTCPLHPMGVDPLLRRGDQLWGEAVLPHDVVQHWRCFWENLATVCVR